MKDIPALFAHQRQTSDFIRARKTVFVSSDPGTGKTRSVLDSFMEYRNLGGKGRMLVVCPKSIMKPAWVNDIDKFYPGLTWAIAKAPDKTRIKAFQSGALVVVINHDAAKWLKANYNELADFEWLVIDESTAFKNPTAKRTKALKDLAPHFDYRVCMSGTPMPNTVMDMWAQMYLVDLGERLGPNYFQTRAKLCTPVINSQFTTWEDKPDSKDMLYDAISDLSIRHKLEDVVDMPEHLNYDIQIDLSTNLLAQYRDLAEESVLVLQDGLVNAVNSAVLTNKLLQLCSGAVYNEDGEYSLVHNERYELVTELVLSRPHSVVAYLWKHQLKELQRLAKKHSISNAAIVASMSPEERDDIVQRFQAGHFQVLFAHPQTAGHGLTLTRAKSLIWSSPTWNSEHYQQFNRRIYRVGQHDRTEIINIAAANTWEPVVYERLAGKIEKEGHLLSLLQTKSNLLAA